MQIIKKHWIMVLGILFVVIGMGSMVASAEDTTTSDPAKVTAPMVVNVGPDGKVLLRGKVTAVATSSLSVEAWGMDWTVNVSSATEIVSANKVLTDIVVGDFIGLSGTISQDGTFVIDAKVLRKWGQRVDSDKDGIPDNQDVDHDNDGNSDVKDGMGHNRGQGKFIPLMGDRRGEKRAFLVGLKPGSKLEDNDQDGVLDSKDLDDDNDGILDSVDSKPEDHDNDGVDDQDEDKMDDHGTNSGNDSVNDSSDDNGGGSGSNSGSGSSGGHGGRDN